jgi:hypothetical protein
VNRRVSRLMKGLTVFAAAALASFAAACGGGNNGITTTPAPTPSAGPFSASSLNGTYAFEMSGQDAAGLFARVGSFTANGSGQVMGGTEDVNSGTIPGSTTLAFSGGSYTLQSNGKGTLSLTNQTGTLQFSVVMTSANGGFITQTDGIATASGNFIVQDTTTFSSFPNDINGPYVFNVSGLDPSGFAESLIGQFTGNATGGISAGIVDINDGATASGPQTMTAVTFAKDNANGPTSGRGTVTFSANGSVFNFAFYIVGANRIKLLRTDFPAVSLGDAIAQSGTIPTSTSAFSGNFAFVLAGASLSGSDVRAGRLSLSGGTIGTNTLRMDDDDSSASGSGNSNPIQIPNGVISAATYAIDMNNSGTGRGTLSFTDSKSGTFSFIFYLISPTQAVIQDNSKGIVADGSMKMQTGGPFTNATSMGNWAFNWGGQSINSTNGVLAAEDFLGQYSQDSAGNISGGVDFTELSAGSVVTNGAFTGSLTITADGTGRNAYKATLATSPSTTLNFSAYFVDPNTMFVVGTDTHRIIAGTVVRNF